MIRLLADLPDGARATVRRVATSSAQLDAAMLQRLAELGFIAGETVQLLRRGPGGREPLAVRVGDTLFALRLCEARCIELDAESA
jgi:ferrous iron transport protein A